MALFAAWSAAFQLIPNLPGTYLFKFNGFPIILSGFVLGPAGGFWCGGLADVVAYLIKPTGPYIPVFTLTSAITGWLPCWIYLKLAPRQGDKLRLSLTHLLVSIGLAQVVTKVLLVTALRAVLFGLPAQVLALRALVEQTVHVPLYAYAVWVVLRRVVLRRRPGSRASALHWADDADQRPERPSAPGTSPVGPQEWSKSEDGL